MDRWKVKRGFCVTVFCVPWEGRWWCFCASSPALVWRSLFCFTSERSSPSGGDGWVSTATHIWTKKRLWGIPSIFVAQCLINVIFIEISGCNLSSGITDQNLILSLLYLALLYCADSWLHQGLSESPQVPVAFESQAVGGSAVSCDRETKQKDMSATDCRASAHVVWKHTLSWHCGL